MSGPLAPETSTDRDPALVEDLGDQLLRLLRLAGRGHASHPEVYREGVEKVGYILLWHLVTGGPQRTSTLADAVRSDISTVSRQATTLVEHGWIERTPDPADGRAFLLVATDGGREIFQRIRERRTEHMGRALRGWPEPEQRTFIRLLERFNDDLETYLPCARRHRTDLETPGENDND